MGNINSIDFTHPYSADMTVWKIGMCAKDSFKEYHHPSASESKCPNKNFKLK
jgi:hypothetical protein